MKKGKIILIAVIVIAIGVTAYLLLNKSAKQQVGWDIERVSRGSISNSVTATGTVEPVTQVEVGTQVSGIIDKIYVDYNSEVKKGQVIAEMDKITLQAELASQEATLASAKSEYEYQQKIYARNKVLSDKQLISTLEFETATYNYEKAKSSYDKAQADIVKTRRNLGYTVITSPIDGVVISRVVEEGQTVAAGFSTPTLFTIAADLTQMQVIADVDEADIGQVKEGQRVTFVVDAYPNDVFEGYVMQVRLEAIVESNVVTYEVVISAPNPDLKLKPGLTATVTIFTLEKNDILTVSPRALKFVPDGAIVEKNNMTMIPVAGEHAVMRKTVWVKNGKELREKEVSTGIIGSTQIEMTGGLTEGEEVVVGMTTANGAGNKVHAAGENQGNNSPFMPQRPGGNRR